MTEPTEDQLNQVEKMVKKGTEVHSAGEAAGFDWSLIRKPAARPSEKALYASIFFYAVSIIIIYLFKDSQAFPLLFIITLALIAWVSFTVHGIYEQRFGTILLAVFGFTILLIASDLVSPQAVAEAFKEWLEGQGES